MERASAFNQPSIPMDSSGATSRKGQLAPVGEMIFDVIEYVEEVSSASGAYLRITALLANGLKIIECFAPVLLEGSGGP
jgi:hypothetical protein